MQTMYEYPDGKRGPARQWAYDGNVYPRTFLVRRDGEAGADFAARLAPLGVTPVRVELPEVDQITHELGEAVEAVESGWIVVCYPNPAPKRAAWDTATRERVLLCSDEPTPEGFTELAPPEDSPFVSWDGTTWVLDEAARLDARAAAVRLERDERLRRCDWTQLADAPLDASQKVAWADYRQALRDVPQQAGFPEVVEWPVEI